MTNQEQYLKRANELYDQIAATHSEKVKLWSENVIFTWQWWLGVVLAVVPWILYCIPNISDYVELTPVWKFILLTVKKESYAAPLW